jgi:hypothetical protein
MLDAGYWIRPPTRSWILDFARPPDDGSWILDPPAHPILEAGYWIRPPARSWMLDTGSARPPLDFDSSGSNIQHPASRAQHPASSPELSPPGVRTFHQEDPEMLEALAVLTLLFVGAVVVGVLVLLAGVLKFVFKLALLPVVLGLKALFFLIAFVVALAVLGPVVLIVGGLLLIPLLILGGLVWAGVAIVT